MNLTPRPSQRPENSSPSWWQSLRARMAVSVVAVTAATLLPTAVLVDHLAAQQSRERLRQVALQQLNTATVAYLVSGDTPVGLGQNLSIAPSSLQQAIKQPGNTATYYDGQTVWAARAVPALGTELDAGTVDTRKLGSQHLVLRLSATSLHAQRNELRKTMQLAGLLAIVFAAGIGWFVASRVSKQLRGTAKEARHLNVFAPEALSTPASNDEVAVLAGAINSMIFRLSERADAERQFSARVAHELRTPVTALVSSAELLPDDEASNLTRRGVQRLHHLVEDLLELFRVEQGANNLSGEQAPLNGTIKAILCKPEWSHVTASGALSENNILVEPIRLERALTNILQNADVHGERPIYVRQEGLQLVITDSGPGFPQWILDEGPTAFRRESTRPGTGLGMSIAHQQLVKLGANITYLNAAHSGAQIMIDFACRESTAEGVDTN